MAKVTAKVTAKVIEESAELLRNENLGPRLYLMTLKAPGISSTVLPGQFVHMKIPGMDDHPLRRPFSVYAADDTLGTIDILYQVVGYGTDVMTGLPLGATLSLVGPVGHGWVVPASAKKVLLVGGGVGAAPLYMLCEHCVASGIETTVVLGAATHGMLVCRKRYSDLLGKNPRCATDDGTYGHAGFCTGLVEMALDEGGYDWVATCGPTPLMRIVAGMAADHGVACSVSMEKKMACGIGACLGCIVDTTDGNKRACVDGPVFPAEKVVW